MPIYWTPRHHSMGDIKILRVGDEYHLFTEQTPLDPAIPFAGSRSVGHAVSKDMFHWEELPAGIACGPPGSFDAFCIYHLDVMVHDGRWHMFYTGLDRPHGSNFVQDESRPQQQAIGLATSDDSIRWEKYAGNPILRADPRYYEPFIPRDATYQPKDHGRLWFRDPFVVPVPAPGNAGSAKASGGWGMIVIARDASKHPDVRACISWATSSDLVHWTPHPPIYSPGRFHTIETPSLLRRGDKHYLFYMLHSLWGTPVLGADPYQTGGYFYAVSDDGPAGPYRQPRDEVLVGAYGQPRFAAMRIIEGTDGNDYLLANLSIVPSPDDEQVKPIQKHGMTAPKRVRFAGDDVHVLYNPAVEALAKTVAVSPDADLKLTPVDARHWRLEPRKAAGKQFQGQATAWLAGAAEFRNAIVSVRLHFLRGERAGLALRASADGATGLRAVLDRRFGRVELSTLDGKTFIDARAWPAADQVELTVIFWEQIVEVYVGSRLMIQNVRYREKAGCVGLLVDHAEAVFDLPRVLVFG